MKKYKLTFILLGLTTTLAFSQTRNMSTVTTNYPEVYKSIEASANRQWGSDLKIKQSVVEGQVDAFISVLDLNDSESVVLTDAIIKNSLPDTKEQNIRAIQNNSGTNLFSKLKCDWYKVMLDYRKNNKEGAPVITPPIKTNAPTRNTQSIVKENDSSFAVEFSQPTTTVITTIDTTPVSTPRPIPEKSNSNNKKGGTYYRKEAVSSSENNVPSSVSTSSSEYNQNKPPVPVRKEIKTVEKKSTPVENNAAETVDDENLTIWF